jgi:hypothetical protein
MRAEATKNGEWCSLVFQSRTVAKPEPANGKTVFRFEDAIVRRNSQTARQCPDNGRVLGGSGAGNERLERVVSLCSTAAHVCQILHGRRDGGGRRKR